MKLKAVVADVGLLGEQPLMVDTTVAVSFLWLDFGFSPSFASKTTVMLDSILDTVYKLLCLVG